MKLFIKAGALALLATLLLSPAQAQINDGYAIATLGKNGNGPATQGQTIYQTQLKRGENVVAPGGTSCIVGEACTTGQWGPREGGGAYGALPALEVGTIGQVYSVEEGSSGGPYGFVTTIYLNDWAFQNLNKEDSYIQYVGSSDWISLSQALRDWSTLGPSPVVFDGSIDQTSGLHLYGVLVSGGLGTYQPAIGAIALNLGDQVPSVPEPETYALLLAGLGLMAGVARRRRQG